MKSARSHRALSLVTPARSRSVLSKSAWSTEHFVSSLRGHRARSVRPSDLTGQILIRSVARCNRARGLSGALGETEHSFVFYETKSAAPRARSTERSVLLGRARTSQIHPGSGTSNFLHPRYFAMRGCTKVVETAAHSRAKLTRAPKHSGTHPPSAVVPSHPHYHSLSAKGGCSPTDRQGGRGGI
jgi:hypothetical protein